MGPKQKYHNKRGNQHDWEKKSDEEHKQMFSKTEKVEQNMKACFHEGMVSKVYSEYVGNSKLILIA